ncbi:MAG: 16S rRNA processing protein RimM [Clostridia bacterium]|nr:16S rRNA processing protein RimM [Clostridia bacterium]
MKQEYFELGQIVNHFGIKGMLKVNPFTDDISKFETLNFILVEKNKKLEKMQIEEVKYSKNQVLLKLKGINTIEEAENYRECYIKIARKDLKELPENTYFIADLIGSTVYTDEGMLLGKVVDIYNTGANDIYVIKDEIGKQTLLPAIKEVIKQIDTEQEKIIVHIIKGLI